MAIIVASPEIQKMFLVMTGEQWPAMNEDGVRAAARKWLAASEELRNEMGPELVALVNRIRAGFEGKAARRFADEMAPFVVAEPM